MEKRLGASEWRWWSETAQNRLTAEIQGGVSPYFNGGLHLFLMMQLFLLENTLILIKLILCEVKVVLMWEWLGVMMTQKATVTVMATTFLGNCDRKSKKK